MGPNCITEAFVREVLVQLNSSKWVHFDDCTRICESKSKAEKKTSKRFVLSCGSRRPAGNR